MSRVEREEVKMERVISPVVHGEEAHESSSLASGPDPRAKLRPLRFEEYPGQRAAKENLRVYVEAAKLRRRPLDHVLLHGPPGLGKTTLAHIVAHELGVPFYNTSGPSIDRPGDLAGILAGLPAGALLFIDEVHRLSIQVEEVLYSAMEDFAIDIVVGQGPTARSVRMEIHPFTLVGATTKLSNLSRPFLSRFGIQERLEFYDVASLVSILERSAVVLGIPLCVQGALEIARRSRGTPRIANRLLRRASDFAEVYGLAEVDAAIVGEALGRLDIDAGGLDRTDRAILRIIEERYQGGPVGIEALAVTLGEERATLEEVYEPFLVYEGYLSRGPRGRSMTSRGREHLAAASDERGGGREEVGRP